MGDLRRELELVVAELGAVVFRAEAPAFDPGEAFFTQFLSEEEANAARAHLKQAHTTGRRAAFEHALRIKGGGSGVARTAFLPVPDGGVLIVTKDISEERHNERQWHELESWLVTLGEALPFDFWICDQYGRLVLQNPASVARHGNLVGRSLRDPAFQRAFERARAGETSREQLTLGEGSARRYISRVVTPLRDGQGVLAVDIEVTELKQTEERLRQSVKELAETQHALVRKEQLAALGEMAAVVAHEVRNPLGAIANVAALLRKRRNFTEADVAICEVIEEEVSRLDGLVRAMLEFVRPVSPMLSPTALDSVVDRALSHALKTEAAEARVTVHREFDPVLPPVPMDSRLLEMAVGNVIRNALQAMPERGELRIKVDAHRHDERMYARIAIKDTGKGLPAEVKARLFQPFVTTRPMGSGLGLAIVKKVVDEHRGNVELQSEHGVGTTCVIRVPLSSEPTSQG